MVKISFLFVELLFAAIWFLIRIIVCAVKKKIDWKQEGLLLLMYINFAVIIRLIFFPRALVGGMMKPLVFNVNKLWPPNVNLVPFVNMFAYKRIKDIIWNVAGNLSMLIPTGILLPIVYKKLNSFWKVIAAGALISLSIEIIQLLFYERKTDVDDLILNVAGCAVGYAIYAIVRYIIRRSRKNDLTEV